MHLYGKTLGERTPFPETVSRPPPPPSQVREGSEALPDILPEGRSIAGGLYFIMPASGMMCE